MLTQKNFISRDTFSRPFPEYRQEKHKMIKLSGIHKARRTGTGLATLGAIFTLFLNVSATSAQQPVMHYTAPPRCSQETLSGTYVTSGTGTIGGVAYTTVGRVTYDGHGNGLASSTQSAGGMISRGTGITAVYTVNPDCTGTKTFGGATTFDFVVSPNGKLIHWIVTNADTVLSGQAVRLELRD
jgi:hypothetical protein